MFQVGVKAQCGCWTLEYGGGGGGEDVSQNQDPRG